MLRIALVGPYPEDGTTPAGGVEAVSMYLSGGLSRLPGVDLHVVTCNFEARKSAQLAMDGVNVHVLPSSKRLRRVRLYASERREIREKLRRLQPDIVQIEGTDMYGAAGVSSGLPCIVTVHGIAYKEATISNPAAKPLQRLHQFLRRQGNSVFERYTLSRATVVIVTSPYVESSIADLSRAEVHFIPNPIGDSFFEIQGNEAEGRVLFVGRLDPKKRVEDLLRAINHVQRQSSRVELHLVGPTFDESYARMLTSYVEREQLTPNVKFLGRVSHEELLHEYGAASLVVLCSAEESSPLAIQQAMAAAKPVVASRAAGVPWLVEDKVTGLLYSTGNVEELADSISRMLTDDSGRRNMGQAGRSRAVDQFLADNVAVQTRALYDRVLAAQAAA